MSNQKPQSPSPASPTAIDVDISSIATERSSPKAKKRRRDSSPERELPPSEADIDSLATERSSPEPKKAHRETRLEKAPSSSAVFFPIPAMPQISVSQSASETSPAAATRPIINETTDFATLRLFAFAEDWTAVCEVLEKSAVLTPEMMNNELERDSQRWINFPQFLVDHQQWDALLLLILRGLMNQLTVSRRATTGPNQGANLLWHLAFHRQGHLISLLMNRNLVRAIDLESRVTVEGPNQGKNVLWLLAFYGKWDLIKKIAEHRQVSLTAATNRVQSGLYEGTNLAWFLAFWQQWETILELKKSGAIIDLTLASSPRRGAECGKNVLWLLAYHNQEAIIKGLMENGNISADLLAAEAQSGLEQGQNALLRLVMARQYEVVLNFAPIITGPMLLSQPKDRPGEHVAWRLAVAKEYGVLNAIWHAVLGTPQLMEVQDQQQPDSMLMWMFYWFAGANPIFDELYLLLTVPMVEKTIRGENLLYRLFRSGHYSAIQRLVDRNLITTAALKSQIEIDHSVAGTQNFWTTTHPIDQGRSAWGLLLAQLFSQPETHQTWDFLEALINQQQIDSHLLLMVATKYRLANETISDDLIDRQLTLLAILMTKMEESDSPRIRNMLQGLLPHVTTQMLLANDAKNLCFLERLLAREADSLRFLPLLSTARFNPLATVDWEDFKELAGQRMLELWLHEHRAAGSTAVLSLSDNYPSFKRLLNLGLPLPTAMELYSALSEDTRRQWEASITSISGSLGQDIPFAREEEGPRRLLMGPPARPAVIRDFAPEVFLARQIKRTVVKFALVTAEMDAYANFPKDIFSLIFGYLLVLDEGATSEILNIPDYLTLRPGMERTTANRHNSLIVAAKLEGRKWYKERSLRPVRDESYDSFLHAVFGIPLWYTYTWLCDDVPKKRKEIAEKIRIAFNTPALRPVLINNIKAMMVTKYYGGNVLITTLKRASQQWESVQEQRLFLLEELLKKNVEAIKYLEKNWDLPALTLAVDPRLHACLARVQKSARLDDFLAIEKILSKDPELLSAYKAYFTAPPFQLEEHITPSLIEKYAASIEQLDHYLMPCDLPLIAALFDIHLICHIPEEGVISYNPQASKTVELAFDGNKIFTCLEQRTTVASFTDSSVVPSTLPPALPEKNGKDEKEVPARQAWIPTSGDGNCAFHAIFGEVVAGEYVCHDAAAKRAQLSEAIINSQPGTIVYELSVQGIVSMVMEGHSGGGRLITALRRNYRDWRSKDEQHIADVRSKMIAHLEKNDFALAYLDASHGMKKMPSTLNEGQKLAAKLHAILQGSELVLAGFEELLTAEQLLDFQAYKDLLKNPGVFDWASQVVPDMIMEYGLDILRPSRFLLPLEVQIIAQVFDKKIIYCTMAGAAPVVYNAAGGNLVEIWFNGVNHFEREPCPRGYSSVPGPSHIELMDDSPIAEVKKSGNGKRLREEESEPDGHVVKVAKQEATQPQSGAVALADPAEAASLVWEYISVNHELFDLINRDLWTEASQLIKRSVIDYKLLFDLAKQEKNPAARLYNLLQFSMEMLPVQQLQELVASKVINTEQLLAKYQGGNLLCYIAAQGDWQFILLLLPQITSQLLLDEADKDSVSIPPAKNFAQFLLGNARSIDLEIFKKIMGHVLRLSFNPQAASKVGAGLNAKDTLQVLRHFTVKEATCLIETFRLPLPELAELHEFLFDSTDPERPTYMQLVPLYENRAQLLKKEQISEVLRSIEAAASSSSSSSSCSHLIDIWKARSQKAESSAAQSQVASTMPLHPPR